MPAPSWPLRTLCSEVLQGREEGGTPAEVETKAQSGNSSMVTRTEMEDTGLLTPHSALLSTQSC